MASQYNELQHSMWLTLTYHCKASMGKGSTGMNSVLSILENAAVKVQDAVLGLEAHMVWTCRCWAYI